MRDFFDTIVCIACFACLLLLLLVCGLTGRGKRLGPWLVRIKHYILDIVVGHRRIDYGQAAILILGAIGIGLMAISDDAARWGIALVLAGQPLWIVETRRKRQWGMFALSIWFTLAWSGIAARMWGWL